MPEPHYQDESVTLHHGDCLDVLRTLPDNSVDAVVTDPPYNLSFMSRNWDTHPTPADFQAWCRLWATECLRVLKPGGLLASFGGTRTFHRLACAIEDAGFEIRDSIGYAGAERPGLLGWVYGSGFPKSLNVTNALESLPACTCSGSAAGGEDLPVVDPLGPTGTVGAGVGAEAGTVPFAGLAADGAVGVGAQVVPAAPSRLANVQALNVDGVGESLPEVLGSATVARAAQSQEVVGLVGSVEVDPEALWDEVVGEEPAGGSAVRARSVTADDGGGDVGPAAPLVLPLTATPGGVVGAIEPLAVVDGHAVAGAVDGGVGPASELIATDDADVDAVPGAPHASHDTPERAVRCEVCGGVRGPIPQGLGTALKPAWEPIVLARKPLVGTVAGNVQAWGTGALNIDACRVGMSESDRERIDNMGGFGRAGWTRPDGTLGDIYEGTADGSLASTDAKAHAAGRWPANVVLDPGAAAELDRQSGTSGSGSGAVKVSAGRKSGDGSWTGSGMHQSGSENVGVRDFGDSGGASRFFPVFRYEAKAPTLERPRVDDVAHATVKPLDLMRWLVRLVTPPGGTVLDMFAGSGTTGEATVLEGFRCILVEREAEYLPLIVQRLSKPLQVSLFGDDL